MVLTTQSINVSNMYSAVPPVGMVISGELVDTNLLSTCDVVWILLTEKRLFHTTLVSCALNSPYILPTGVVLYHNVHQQSLDKGWCWSHL